MELSVILINDSLGIVISDKKSPHVIVTLDKNIPHDFVTSDNKKPLCNSPDFKIPFKDFLDSINPTAIINQFTPHSRSKFGLLVNEINDLCISDSMVHESP